jgi:hypothetical protein
MTNSSHKTLLASLAVSVLAGLALAPLAEAAGRGGGHGGGGHHAGGGGKRQVQAKHDRTDVRTNNVRSTSVNNVNVNRNVNVNVDNHHGGWDDDYHPVATAAAVTAAVAVTSAVVGSIVRSVPPGCVPVNYGGIIYQQCGSTWYQPQGTQYIVINPPY